MLPLRHGQEKHKEKVNVVGSRTASKRDIEKVYPKKDFIAKLRRLADLLERSKGFRLQVAGTRITVPKRAIINIEHERGAGEEEVEFQLKWKIPRR